MIPGRLNGWDDYVLTPVAPSGFDRIDHPSSLTFRQTEELAGNMSNFVCKVRS